MLWAKVTKDPSLDRAFRMFQVNVEETGTNQNDYRCLELPEIIEPEV